MPAHASGDPTTIRTLDIAEGQEHSCRSSEFLYWFYRYLERFRRFAHLVGRHHFTARIATGREMIADAPDVIGLALARPAAGSR